MTFPDMFFTKKFWFTALAASGVTCVIALIILFVILKFFRQQCSTYLEKTFGRTVLFRPSIHLDGSYATTIQQDETVVTERAVVSMNGEPLAQIDLSIDSDSEDSSLVELSSTSGSGSFYPNSPSYMHQPSGSTLSEVTHADTSNADSRQNYYNTTYTITRRQDQYDGRRSPEGFNANDSNTTLTPSSPGTSHLSSSSSLFDLPRESYIEGESSAFSDRRPQSIHQRDSIESFTPSYSSAFSRVLPQESYLGDDEDDDSSSARSSDRRFTHHHARVHRSYPQALLDFSINMDSFTSSEYPYAEECSCAYERDVDSYSD